MSGRRGLCLLSLGLVVCGWVSTTAVAASWDKLLTLRRVEADPNKSYRLTEENGPWMIMACSFSGERAAEQAKELALELRSRYKLEAYTYQKTFKLEEQAGARGVDRFGEPRRVRYRRGSEFEEVAVLVGNYPAIDAPDAQETLHKLKYYRPKCLELDRSRPTARNLASWRLFWSYVSPETQKKGPMAHAMLTTNPLLGEDYFAPKGLDPLVLEANEGVEHCLLDCPGKYTVQVATFRGQVVIKPSEIAAIKSGHKKMKSQLVEAAEKAHKLTEALRLKGYQAYEFHDRYASLVTVGSFDWISRQLPDGSTQFNPAIEKILNRFGPVQNNLGAPTGGVAVPTLVGIPFDVQPRVVHVPRRSISAECSRGITRLF